MTNLLKYSIAFSLLIGSSHAAPPSAGNLLQDVQKQFDRAKVTPAKPSGLDIKAQAPTKKVPVGVKILVTSFQFSGNTLIKSEELEKILTKYINLRLTFSELQNVARDISNYYQAKGFMARTFLPPQEVEHGEIEIMILEGNLSGLEIDVTNLKNFDTKKAQAIIETAHPIGEKLQTKKLERGLLLLGDIPGIVSSGSLISGDKAGDSKLKLKIEDSSRYDIYTNYSNTGSKSTGSDQLTVSAIINSPLSMGERFSVQGMLTKGIRYINGGFSIPLNASGLKVGLSASAMVYDIITDLDADGTAKTIGTWISYPLVRSTKANLNLTLNYDEKYYLNNVSGITINDKDTKGLSLTLDGTSYDSSGQTSFRATFTRSKLDLTKVNADYLADQASTQTNGYYSKLLINTSRTQILTPSVYIFLSATVQKSNKNLDSAEKFYLGGASGVRAYPSNEAGGDEGFLTSAEIVKSFSHKLSLGLFYDYGGIRQHKELYAGWQGFSTAENTYRLRATGVNLNFRHETWSAKATLAFKHGDNPNQRLDGTDNDGTNRDPRFWVQLSKVF